MKVTLGLLPAAIVLILSGCQGSGDDDPPDTGDGSRAAAATESAEPADEAPAEPAVRRLWHKTLPVIGQPMLEDGVAVVVTRAPQERLRISGYDMVDGERLWRHPFATGDVTIPRAAFGLASRSADGAGYAVFVLDPDHRPAGDAGAVRFTAVDVSSGKVARVSPPVRPGFQPGPCDDDTDVCFSITPGDERRWSLSTWRLSKVPPYPKGMHEIAPEGLYTTGTFGEDRPDLGRFVDGKRIWERALLQIVGKEHGDYIARSNVTPDYVEPAGQYVLTVHDTTAPKRRGRFLTSAAGGAETVSIDAATGDVAWRDGSDVACFERGIDPIHPGGEVRVRCRMGGRILYREGASVVSRGDGFRIDVEGYDVRTGETIWSERIKDRAAKRWWVEPQALVSPSVVALDTIDGRKAVRIVDGSEVTPGDPFWCEGRFPAYWHDDRWAGRVRRAGGRRFFVCDAEGKPATGTPDALAFAEAFPQTDDVHVVATSGGVTGYAVR